MPSPSIGPEPADPAAAPLTLAASDRQGFLPQRLVTTLAGAAILACVALAAAPWLLASPERISRLVARAAPELRADVRFGAVKLGWLGPLVLEDIQIVPRDGSPEPITVKRVEVSSGLAAILLSLGDLGRLRVAGLDARIVFDAQRRSNLEGLVEPRDTPGAAPAAAGAPRSRRSPVRLDIDVVDAIVRIAGPWTPDPWVSDPINVHAALGPAADGLSSEWNIEPVQLLDEARLEPAVAQGVLAYIAPIMADATRMGGRFSLRLDAARLPLGAPEDARVSGVLAMHAVDLGPGPLAARIIEALPLGLKVPAAIRVADESHIAFRVADRKVWHEGLAFGVPLPRIGERLDLKSSGSVGLVDKALDLKLELPLPAKLPSDKPVLAALAGRTLSVRVGGILGEPRVDFDGSLRAAAGGVVSELVSRLRREAASKTDSEAEAPTAAPPSPARAPSAPDEATPLDDRAAEEPKPRSASDASREPQADHPTDPKIDPTAKAVIDLVGGVLEGVARRRAERQAAEADNPPGAPPPRRGRLLRRGAAPRSAPEAGDRAPARPEIPDLEPVPRPAG